MPHPTGRSDKRLDWTGAATFSRDGVYRYRLSRVWNDGTTMVNFLMLNPSTADATHDDPTVYRCVERAWRLGCRGVIVTNLFALRSTDPRALQTVAAPVGPRNDAAILRAALASDVVIAAWGEHGLWNGRSRQVVEMLARHHVGLHCLGTNRSGEPRHPLYLSYDVPLKPFHRRGAGERAAQSPTENRKLNTET